LQPIASKITKDARPTIIDAPLTIISRMWQGVTIVVVFKGLLICIVLIIIGTYPVCFFDLPVGRIILETFGVKLIFFYAGVSGSSITLFCSMLDSFSASQLTSQAFGESKSPLQSSKCLVSEIHSDA
jgi:hypothetical protein